MLCDPQASGLLRSNLKSAVYIPSWPLSNIVFLITNDAAISDKQKKTNIVCSQSCPEADARSRDSLSTTARSQTFPPNTMLVQHWGLPSSCTSLPADNSTASSSRASSWINKTRRKTKVRRNITSYVCFLSDCCLDWANQPDFPLKRLKEVQVSILVYPCQHSVRW